MVRKATNMKRTSILALLSALAIPALGDDLKITINPPSETEVAAAAAAGFSSVEEWYAYENKTVFLPFYTKLWKQTWDSLSPEVQRSLHKAESKWQRWYNSLPSRTPQDIGRRINALMQHDRELQAWLPKTPIAAPTPDYPPTIEGMGTPMEYPHTTQYPPTLEQMGTPMETPRRPPTIQESGTPLQTPAAPIPRRPPTTQESGTPPIEQ